MLKPLCTLATATVAVLGTTQPAQAFCRETVESPISGACSEGPNETPLTWARSCVTYTFSTPVFERVEGGESLARNAFSAAFQAWADVDCDGRKPFFVEQAEATTSSETSEFKFDRENISIISVRTQKEWIAAADHVPQSIALTLVWFSKRTGEIRDFDMELNGGAGTFTDCVAQRCGVGKIDLQNTVTHEAGHLLGLAHSSVAGATMEAAAFTGPETQKRSLAQDDEQGYCALSLPPHSCTGTGCVCPPPPIYPSSSGGCSCQLTQRATPKLALSAGAALLGLIGLWRGRVVRRRGPPPPRAP